jgi:hypothetical protein
MPWTHIPVTEPTLNKELNERCPVIALGASHNTLGSTINTAKRTTNTPRRDYGVRKPLLHQITAQANSHPGTLQERYKAQTSHLYQQQLPGLTSHQTPSYLTKQAEHVCACNSKAHLQHKHPKYTIHFTNSYKNLISL